MSTLQKKDACAQLFDLEKCFKKGNFYFYHMIALVYVVIDQGIHKGKMEVALNEKRKKLRGFSFSINIANFEAFLSVFKLTKNPLFLKSVN